jgi:hypothetical protein
VQVRELDLFGPVCKQVQIAQRKVKRSPTDKFYNAWISILAGAHDRHFSRPDALGYVVLIVLNQDNTWHVP